MIALGLHVVVSADGGVLRARQVSGPFTVSVFTAPEPLRAGPVDVSVFVQSSDGAVLTDAVVYILVDSTSSPNEQRRARASHGAASNQLAQAAVIDLPAAGEWTLTVSVRADGNAADVRCVLTVAPAASRMMSVWPWLLAPPAFIALFALHQTLKERSTSTTRCAGG